jgi:hypothetical protein
MTVQRHDRARRARPWPRCWVGAGSSCRCNTIRMGSDVAEAQIDDLSDAETDVLLEIYEVLRLTPDNGRKLGPTGNIYVWDGKGISVTYVLLDPQREGAAG